MRLPAFDMRLLACLRADAASVSASQRLDRVYFFERKFREHLTGGLFAVALWQVGEAGGFCYARCAFLWRHPHLPMRRGPFVLQQLNVLMALCPLILSLTFPSAHFRFRPAPSMPSFTHASSLVRYYMAALRRCGYVEWVSSGDPQWLPSFAELHAFSCTCLVLSIWLIFRLVFAACAIYITAVFDYSACSNRPGLIRCSAVAKHLLRYLTFFSGLLPESMTGCDFLERHQQCACVQGTPLWSGCT